MTILTSISERFSNVNASGMVRVTIFRRFINVLNVHDWAIEEYFFNAVTKKKIQFDENGMSGKCHDSGGSHELITVSKYR